MREVYTEDSIVHVMGFVTGRVGRGSWYPTVGGRADNFVLVNLNLVL